MQFEEPLQADAGATHPSVFWRRLFGKAYPEARERYLRAPSWEPWFGKYQAKYAAAPDLGNPGPKRPPSDGPKRPPSDGPKRPPNDGPDGSGGRGPKGSDEPGPNGPDDMARGDPGGAPEDFSARPVALAGPGPPGAAPEQPIPEMPAPARPGRPAPARLAPAPLATARPALARPLPARPPPARLAAAYRAPAVAPDRRQPNRSPTCGRRSSARQPLSLSRLPSDERRSSRLTARRAARSPRGAMFHCSGE